MNKTIFENKILIDETTPKGWIYLERFNKSPSNYGLKAKIYGYGYLSLDKFYSNDEEAIKETRQLVSKILGEIY